MAFEKLKDGITDVDTNVKNYVTNIIEYYQLKSFKILMRSISSLTKFMVVGFAVMLTILLLSIAASYGIGQALDNIFYGFLVVGLFFIVVSICIYFLRNKLDKPLLKMFSKFYFEQHETN